MCKSFLLFSVSLTLSFKHVLTIPCDFKFVEIDPFYPDKFLNRIDVSKIKNNSKANPFDFECEELDDKYLRTKSLKISEQQFVFANPDEDSYEESESTCQVRRRTIQPKALNNIYNKLTKVVNTASFVQSIHIEQCLTRNEPCNSAMAPPLGQKHICRQKHVKITLKALKESDGNAIVDEQFYYPSHCVCELVKIKKKKISKCRPIGPPPKTSH